MQATQRPVTQALLNTDLNELAHSLVRELAMAFRKVSIYGPSHPLSLKSLEKPFLICGQFFRVRKYLTINVQRGNLYVANIALKDSVFNTQIMQYFQMLEMKAILFDATLTADEFLFFVSTLVKRETLYDAGFSMTALLKEQRMKSIEVNSESAYDLFENRRQYRGDVDGDFSVRRMALDQMGGSIDQTARLSGASVEYLLAQKIDFYPEIVGYLLPDRVAATPWQDIRHAIVDLVKEINESSGGNSAAADSYMAIFRLIELHPDRKKINADLSAPTALNNGSLPQFDQSTSTGKIRIESAQKLGQLLDKLFDSRSSEHGSVGQVPAEFSEAFARLLKTGQIPQAHEVIKGLIERLSSPDAFTRQRSLDLLSVIVADLNLLTSAGVLEHTITLLCAEIAARRESYEYSEMIWCVGYKCLAGKRYDYLSKLTGTLSSRRGIDNGVTTYDSMAIKKAFENLNRQEVLTSLVDDLIKAKADDVVHIKSILIAIGSEEIALALSQIISHPLRPVRQMSLKILAELGKNSLKVFSDLLVDDAWFERERDRHELPDAKWYVVRNTIFVLGSLRDRDGVTSLRLRINDSDIRVRREIISALEKIGGDEAVDLLVVMAEDRDREVRDAALATVGIIGTPECVPMVIDIAMRNPADSIRAVQAIGKIGGDSARQFLGDLLEDDNALSGLAGGKVSREELKASIVRALGNIGDAESISKIKAYQESLSAAQKLLMRGSAVAKAITEVLSRH